LLSAPDVADWQRELAAAIGSLDELAAALGLEAGQLGDAGAVPVKFPLRVPRGFVRRMRRGDPRDPLLLQVLPSPRELTEHTGFLADPLGELDQLRHPGLLQKYDGRALLVVTGACAVHCRYCFRREFPYVAAGATPSGHGQALAQIEADRTIREVILSGGDPLSLSNKRLRDLMERLGRIGHVARIRIHSRMPIVLPERIDSELIDLLREHAHRTVLVLHSNHANEIDQTVGAAVGRLRDVCAAVLNQSVLLRAVNDSGTALVELSERLFAIGVLPYYLHLLDPVRGTAHFRVGPLRARRILGEAAARLPGYLVPRLARERNGLGAKELLAPILHNRAQAT
jgi:EF-P beta-lysylation protein EpmB